MVMSPCWARGNSPCGPCVVLGIPWPKWPGGRGVERLLLAGVVPDHEAVARGALLEAPGLLGCLGRLGGALGGLLGGLGGLVEDPHDRPGRDLGLGLEGGLDRDLVRRVA